MIKTSDSVQTQNVAGSTRCRPTHGKEPRASCLHTRASNINSLLVKLGWWRGTVVERRSLAGELPCPALDLQLMGDH